VGDEGGFAPNLKSNEEAIESVLEAISQAVTSRAWTSACVSIRRPASSSSTASTFSRNRQERAEPGTNGGILGNWVSQYPAIISIEDGMSEEDWGGWKLMTDTLGKKIQLVADDIFVTNRRSSSGASTRDRQFDPDQGEPDRHAQRDSGSHAHGLARQLYRGVSHRSGETEDPFIADLVVATGAGQIKTGSASRTDRIVKYNQLLRIEEQLGPRRNSSQEGIPAMTKLVLIRHGESTWNKENRFTGWTDVELSDKGRQEALEGGRVLKAEGYTFDVAYTSVLRRAIHTLWTVLDEMELAWIPVYRSWRLNERHYGALQGLNKAETAAKFGEDQVKIWRRSYDIRRPRSRPMTNGIPATIRGIAG